jgi:hypothetical protein
VRRSGTAVGGRPEANRPIHGELVRRLVSSDTGCRLGEDAKALLRAARDKATHGRAAEAQADIANHMDFGRFGQGVVKLLGKRLMKEPDGKESARRAQPRQRDRDEPADRSLGPQAAGGAEGVDAVGGELVRRDVVPEVAGRCDLGQEALDQVMDMLLRSGEVGTPVQECGEFGAGVLV